MVYTPHGHDLKGAVDGLGDEINCTCVNVDDITQAFRTMHPYHLNQVGLAVLQAVKHREGRRTDLPSPRGSS